jgi:hypothetical protein
MIGKMTGQQYGQTKTGHLSVVSVNRQMALLLLCALIFAFSMSAVPASGGDLKEVLTVGKLRHLGIPYANFVSDQGCGLDVDLMKRFAVYLGVE